ncbi:hypothetical protein DPMN_054614 [Dreissena polymorpha]|uniref:Uncharacterized protein n=1 Tax=Dreissena polymorpha TaxID=45954 RepID=A0A9D4CNF8_DREPO|nr:hypothetical protein DPMN_054614 [Dreissena polymorpha]
MIAANIACQSDTSSLFCQVRSGRIRANSRLKIPRSTKSFTLNEARRLESAPLTGRGALSYDVS